MNTNRLIHAGFWFGKTDVREALKLAEAGIGGFCIYFGSTKEVKELISLLRDASPSDLIISADYEYGLGRWHKDAPLLPSNISVGAAGIEDLAYKKGLLTARQAREIGVDWIFAPNLDLADTPANPIVNTRSFGKDPNAVAALAKAFMLGLSDGGCLNCLKHFPGHGSTTLDSHLAMPEIKKSREKLFAEDILPYGKLLTKADAIMAGHLLVPSLDPNNPASFSVPILQGIIRKELRYKGLIVTDALVMKATGGLDPVDAFKAGADILLCPDNPLELIPRLKEEIRKDRSYVARAISAISAQEMMVVTLKAAKDFAVRNYEEEAEKLSAETASQCICLNGENIDIKKNKTVRLLEPDIYPEKGPQAEVFYNTLREEGVRVKPYKEGEKCEYLIVSTMANYAAFSGKINFTDEQKTLINNAAAQAAKTILVSFGSPFVNEGLKLNSFLFAGTQTAAFQKECALVLAGKAEAKGKMPV